MGFQPQNISSIWALQPKKASPVPVVEGQHSLEPSGQQTDIHSYNLAKLSPCTTNDLAAYHNAQVNPVPIFQQRDHVLPALPDQTGPSKLMANGHTRAVLLTRDNHCPDFLSGNQVQYLPIQVNPANRGDSESEKLKNNLRRCGIPQENWKYYLLPPKQWDYSTIPHQV